jgi:heat shock protein HslJ
MPRFLPAAILLAAAMALPASADVHVAPWVLQSLDGGVVAVEVTLDLADPERVTGQAPCNRYFAGRSGTPPAFRLEAIGATKMACPELALEAEYFSALAEVTAIEETEDRLVLRGEGTELVFAHPAD